MKRFIPFFFLLCLLVSACAPALQTTEESTGAQPMSTAEESQAAPQSAIAPQTTPLPDEINAPLIDSPAIVNIEMLDEVYGWAVTDENIIRTNDGGVTWYDVTPANLADAGYLVYTDFFDVNRAWVQFPDMNRYPNGGKLYRTTDGGVTWESFNTPFSGGSMHFVDESNGWVMADLGVGAGSMAVSIFQTRDGGKTWERTYTNDPNFADSGDTLPLGGIKNLIVPLNTKTAWVGGVVYAPGQTYLFRSDDGGETWFNINLVLPKSTDESELSVQGILFVSPQEGLLALRVTSDSPETIVYITKDGGNTWTQLPVTFEGYGILETPSAREMIFYTADQFYVTKDAGANVEQITPDVKFGDSVIDMSFANSQTGWVVASNSSGDFILYKTTDGGATWTALTE
ncbi:MAG: hypothetical protein OHK003_33060 [Anaerolineales bacterium]